MTTIYVPTENTFPKSADVSVEDIAKRLAHVNTKWGFSNLALLSNTSECTVWTGDELII